MDRTHGAQKGRMEFLAKVKQAAARGKDATRMAAAKKAPIKKFREEIIERILGVARDS